MATINYVPQRLYSSSELLNLVVSDIGNAEFMNVKVEVSSNSNTYDKIFETKWHIVTLELTIYDIMGMTRRYFQAGSDNWVRVTADDAVALIQVLKSDVALPNPTSFCKSRFLTSAPVMVVPMRQDNIILPFVQWPEDSDMASVKITSLMTNGRIVEGSWPDSMPMPGDWQDPFTNSISFSPLEFGKSMSDEETGDIFEKILSITIEHGPRKQVLLPHEDVEKQTVFEYMNAFGCPESIAIPGDLTRKIETSGEVAMVNSLRVEYDKRSTEKFELQAKNLPPILGPQIRALIASEEIYMIDNYGSRFRVFISDHSYDGKIHDLSDLKITLERERYERAVEGENPFRIFTKQFTKPFV